MYATDRRQTKASLNTSALWGRRHNNSLYSLVAERRGKFRTVLRKTPFTAESRGTGSYSIAV